MKDNKKNIVFMAIGAITLIVVTLGATYAYFTAQSGGGANIDTNVITGTTDNLSFSFGDLINIYATEENFAQGMGNLTDNTTAQAILRANNTSNEATANYNIYLIIESNNFEYTTSDQTPEILLNVTDPNGNPVENITGLVHYEDGFDITTRTGGYLLVPDYEISATDVQTIQDWNIEVTFVNLDSDQNANTNKTLTGKLYLTQDKMSSYELTEISNVSTTTTYNSITVSPEITAGSAAVSKYYYGIENTAEELAYNDVNELTRLSNAYAAIEDVEFIESEEASHTFSNLQPNSSYTVYSYTVDENKIKSNVYETTVTTGEYVAPVVDSVSHSVTLNSITVNVTASNGSNEIVKYMYSKDNGASWEESTSNTHTFDGLTDSTEYKIKVKVVDSEGNESTEYYEAITTEIYILPVVASVDATTTWNSITLTPSGTNGTNTIDYYEYSIDNGAYQTSNVFNNLNENTQYTIRVKAIDSAGRESNVYETTVRTDTYDLPVINNVTVDSTKDTITINVNATGGDGSIVSYHYSRDDGSNYQSSNNNSYTFNDLTSSTTFYIKVYVTDSNGRTSSEYSASVTTESDTVNMYFANISNTNFSTYCQPQVSYDNGGVWQNISMSNTTGGSIEIQKGAMLKVNYTMDNNGYGCGINICSSADCSSSNSGENTCNSNTIYTINGQSTTYTVNNDVYYSLVYCVCLVENTEIFVLDKKKKRKKKIKDIKKGDLVYLVDNEGNTVLKKVNKIHKNRVNYIYKVTLENGEVIECSSKHTFIEKTLGTILVDELKEGYELLTYGEQSQKIVNIEMINYSEGIDVYNLSFDSDNACIFAIGGAMILTFGIMFASYEMMENVESSDEGKYMTSNNIAAVVSA